VGVAELEGFAGAVLGPDLHEVELTVVEPEVGAQLTAT
jgi:hypothetical protein